MTYREECVNWIKEYFKDNPDGKAIIGISGGKDSTIAAALCVEALGADRVIGVLMPQGKQNDIDDSYEVCGVLGIEQITANIENAFTSICEEVGESLWMYGGAYKTENHFRGRINVSFGIGTFLSNDTCEDALNIVIKLQYVNGHPVAKLSDDWGKAMCQNDDYLEYLKNAVDYRLNEGI